MSQEEDAAKGAQPKHMERAEIIVRSVERLVLILGIATVILFFAWKYIDVLGSGVLFVGIFLVVILVFVEILLIDRHRSQRK